MSANEIDLVAQKQFSIDSSNIQIVSQEDGNGKAHDGSGNISINDEGLLFLKMYCQGSLSLKDVLEPTGKSPDLGEIFQPKHFYRLVVKDTHSNEWRADNVWLNIDAGNCINGYVVTANINELKYVSPSSSKSHFAQLFFPSKAEIPCNKWIEKKKVVGGEESLVSGEFSLAQFNSSSYKFEIEPREQGFVLTVSSDSKAITDTVIMRVVESLQFVLFEHLSWSFARIVEGSERTVRIRSIAQNRHEVQMGTPVRILGPVGGALTLFDKYFTYVLNHNDSKTWHLVSNWVHIVIEAGTVSLDVRALLLSVAVEGVLRDCFSGIFTANTEESDEVKVAGRLISNSELSQKTKVRIGGFLANMLQPRAKDILNILKDKGLIPDKFSKAYERLRNPFAHGDFSSISDPQQQLDGCLKVQVLFNHLVFLLISYQGKYLDYSTRGFPDAEFTKLLSDGNVIQDGNNKPRYTKGSWLTLGVSGWISWPDDECKIIFDGHELVLRPKLRGNYPTVSILLNKIDRAEGWRVLNQFLSILSWIDGQSAELKYGMIGCCPLYVGQENIMSSIKPTWAFEGFKRAFPKDSKQRLALGLYREAITVNSMPYQFLSYYKVISICLGENKETNLKINELLPKIVEESAVKRIKELQATGKDIGEYLYAEKRTAIAHVTHDPIINPDELDGHIFYNDIYLVKALAEYLIENELKISKDFWLIG